MGLFQTLGLGLGKNKASAPFKMKIYLDTKDLINIVEKSVPCDADSFEKFLKSNGHELILSFVNVLEISSPLLNKSIETNVMQLLNRIEKMPIRYIADSKIFRLELIESYNSFTQGREYRKISPFVKRFDDTIVWEGPSATKIFLNFSLAEIVFTLWTDNPQLFKGFQKYNPQMQAVIGADRSSSYQPSLIVNFIKTIGMHLKKNKVLIPSQNLSSFAKWIYENKNRCPSIRIVYEAYHKIKKNIQDIPNHHDIPDLTHIACVPYVDFITLDRRMSTYASQAILAANMKYKNKIYKNIEEIFTKLNFK